MTSGAHWALLLYDIYKKSPHLIAQAGPEKIVGLSGQPCEKDCPKIFVAVTILIFLSMIFTVNCITHRLSMAIWNCVQSDRNQLIIAGRWIKSKEKGKRRN